MGTVPSRDFKVCSRLCLGSVKNVMLFSRRNSVGSGGGVSGVLDVVPCRYGGTAGL